MAAVMAVLLWTATVMLRSWRLAIVAGVPFVSLLVGMVVSRNENSSHSGSVACLLVAGAFAVWLKAHLAGRGTSRLAVLGVGFLCALAAALTQKALLVAAAFAVYLALYSRGRARLLGPLAVAGLVIIVYIAMNPVVLLHPAAGPWDMGAATTVRRLAILRRHIHSIGSVRILCPGSCFSLVYATREWLFFLPVIPAACVAAWACRNEKWFPVALIFGAFLLVCVFFNVLADWSDAGRYSDPARWGCYLLLSVCVLSVVGRVAGTAHSSLQRECGPTDQAPQEAPRCPLRRGGRVGPAITLFVLSVIVVLAVVDLLASGTLAVDEPLWFMRSRVPPCDVSTEDYRHWAIDAPAVNRWIYCAVLHATSLDEVPADEASHWSMRNGRICWDGAPIPPELAQYYSDRRTLEDWVAYAGKYAPRKAILAMRAVNVSVFTAYAILAWAAARLILDSYHLLMAVSLPIVLSPDVTVAGGVAMYVWSGDVFMMAAMASAFLAWLRYHLQGKGVSRKSIVVVSCLIGLAVASKLHALLMLWAFMAYLLWQSRGRRRLSNPLLAALLALGVFIAVNPAVLAYPGAYPWEVLGMMVARRADVISRYLGSYGRVSLWQLVNDHLYWWPVLPVACIAMWSCRREKWFPPVFLMGSFLTVGTILGFVQTGKADHRYLAPLEYGLYFATGVSIVTLARRARASLRHRTDLQTPGTPGRQPLQAAVAA